MAEPNYGSDISAKTDLDATFRMVSGVELMSEVCLRRLYCRRGGLLGSPNANTLDARDFLNTGLGRGGLASVSVQCQAAILGDPRVLTCTVTPSYDAPNRALTLRVQGVGAAGPFALTLSVNDVTIELLRAQ